MAASPLPSLDPVTGVWDGRELLVAGIVTRTGKGAAAAYNPTTNTWRTLPTPPRVALSQDVPQAVWTGREMIVLGAQIAYNPATNSWRVLPDSPDASRGDSYAMVWTGHLVLSYGGGCCGGPDDYAAAYNPSTNTWTPLPKSPLGAAWVSGVWTGRELIVIAQPTEQGFPTPNTAAYNPTTRTWRLLAPLPEQRSGATATWDGHEVLLVGGWTTRSGQHGVATSNLAYNPVSNTWHRFAAGDHGRVDHAVAWTGHQLLVWGGGTINADTTFTAAAHGITYSPATSRWTALPSSPLKGRMNPLMVWTGHSAIVWGGGLTDGAIYTP